MALWDLKASFYESARRLFPFNLVLKQEQDNLGALLRKTRLDGKSVLDMGTGTGETLRLLPRQSRVYAMDRSLKMLKQTARKRSHHPVVGDGLAVPFKSATFDIITAVGVFEYCHDNRRLLHELRRVMSPYGSLILTYSPPNPLNRFRFVLGHRIYFMKGKDITAFLERSGFVCKAHLKSRIQGQLLLKKR